MTAKALAFRSPELKRKFPGLRSSSDQVLLATARALAMEAVPVKDKFSALDTPANFVEELEAKIAGPEKAMIDRHTALRWRATASMEEKLERGPALVEHLKAAVHRKLEGNDALRAAWLSASRATSRQSKSVETASPADGGTEKGTDSAQAPA